MTTKTIVIGKGDVSATVVPSLGGGLARFDFAGHPVFRPWPEGGSRDPFALACNLLMPWSNRISGGGFHVDGVFHALEPNLPGEPYPIHGNGFQSEWVVGATAPDSVTLTLESDGPGPYSLCGGGPLRGHGQIAGNRLAYRQQGAARAALWARPASMAATNGGNGATGACCCRMPGNQRPPSGPVRAAGCSPRLGFPSAFAIAARMDQQSVRGLARAGAHILAREPHDA